MLRYATEYYYQTKISRLEAKLEAYKAKLAELGVEVVDNEE